MRRHRSFWTGAAVLAMATVAVAGPAAAQPAADRLITSTTMGSATLGATEAELATQLGGDYVVTGGVNPLVDLEGAEVTRDGVVQFWALHVAGEGPELDIFITENPEYQLATGIGPGSTIADASAEYGEATIVPFDPDFESREFVTFAAGPDDGILLQVAGPDGGFAGIYPEESGSFNEPTGIRDGSVITRVWILCRGNCPRGGTLPDTGVSDNAVPLAVAGVTAIALGALMLAGRVRRPTA